MSVFTASGIYVGKAGRFGDKPDEFRAPYGIGTDGDGAIWVSDAFNHRISRWQESPAGTFRAGSSVSWAA